MTHPALTDIELVNPIPPEECTAWHQAMAVSFLEDPMAPTSLAAADLERAWWQPERRWGARVDGEWVATLGTLDRSLTVPGARGGTEQIAADALTWVTVAATHRRRGVLSAMLQSSLSAAKDRGDPVSVLVAAEWPIYGRFGYAVAETTATYVLNPRDRGGTVERASRGSFRRVAAQQLSVIGPDLHAASRRGRSGEIDRPADWWEMTYGSGERQAVLAGRVGGRMPVCVVHYAESGTPDGYLTWTPVRGSDVSGQLGAIVVSDLVASTPSGYRALWEYLTGIDLVSEITLTRRPVDEAARWLLGDGRALRQTYAGDGTWLRLLDLPAALAARRYRVEGSLVLEVIDAQGWAAGRVALEGGPEGATCVAAPTRSPDLRLDHRLVASAYLGGYSLRQLAILGLCDELTSGAAARFDTMFGTDVAPWTSTIF